MYYTIAIDTMGGDFGPCVTVPASIKALLSNSKMQLILVGDPKKILLYLSSFRFSLKNRLKIIPTTSIIDNNISLAKAIRNSNGSSMRIALELVQQGQAQACISAGHTGVLMALSKILIKPLKKIERPALMTIIPNKKNKKTLILDLGANINCNSNMLVQFAIMGSILFEQIFNLNHPKVALLNIGKEISKGLNNIKEAAKILKKYSKINYIGYIESNDLLSGKTDVLVCDGFVGNVMLKTMEGSIKIFLSILEYFGKRKNEKFWIKIIMKFLNKELFDYLYYFHPDQYNGSCLLGLKNIVIKSHGAANKNAFFFAIKQAEKAIICKIPDLISKKFEKILSE